MIEWLKSKWQWILAGLAVLIAALVGVSRRDQSAVAYAKLKEADKAAREAEEKATNLNAEADRLARQVIADAIRAEAEKEKLKNATPSDVDAFLRDRGAIK